jgi:hypothetical protein
VLDCEGREVLRGKHGGTIRVGVAALQAVSGGQCPPRAWPYRSAPRRILAAALKQIASVERANAARRQRTRERLVANPSDLEPLPDAPP